MEYTQADVDRILEASEKATPGPWKHGYIISESPISTINRQDGELLAVVQECRDHASDRRDQVAYRNANALFIAGAPILAEEVKRLRAKNNSLRGILLRAGYMVD